MNSSETAFISILLKKYNPSSQLKFSDIKNRWNWGCRLTVSKQRLIGQFAKKIEISGGIRGRQFCQKWPENGVFRVFLKKILLLQGWNLSYLEQFFKANTMALTVFPNQTCHPPKDGFEKLGANSNWKTFCSGRMAQLIRRAVACSGFEPRSVFTDQGAKS